MNVKEHLNFSLYSTTLLVAGFTFKEYTNVNIDVKDVVDLITGVVFGAMLPDIDHKNSILGKILPLHLLHSLFKKINIYIFKHGGITHTVFANLILFSLAFYFKSYALCGISFGYFTHIYIDHITGNKLPMLYFPFYKKKGR